MMSIDVKENSDGYWFYSFAIEKDTASISKADLLTTSAPENDHIFITTILQNALAVKYGKKILYSGKISGDTNTRYSKDDTIYDIDEDELWSDYEETHALDEIDPETGWTVGEPFLYI